jgi:oxysterol 7-alpha-hydroxylase
LVAYTYTHPEILPELRAEVDAVERAFLLENPSESPTGLFSNLGFLDAQFPLLNSLINETLRLCSNGTSVREVMNDIVVQVPTQAKSDKLSGPGSQPTLFRKGDMIYIPNRFHHLNPDEFEDPETFQPKRFMPNAKRQPGFFIPFGGGVSVVRACSFTPFLKHVMMLFPLYSAVAATLPQPN